MTLVKPPKRPDARAADASPQTVPNGPHTPLWGLILGAVCLLVIGVVIGVILPISPPSQQAQRPAQESRWRMSNICIAAYGMQYAGRLDSAELAIACDDMAQAYISGHPDTVNQCLSQIWDIDAAMCIDASGIAFDTAPLEAATNP